MAYSAIPHLLFLCLIPFLPLFAATNIISLGTSVTANGDNSSWVSPSGEFAFGFRQLNNTNTFLLAIWYANLPTRTIVWYANTSSPIPANSKFNLTENGLTINDTNGQTIWQVQPNTTVSQGTILDVGNFVLLSSTSSSDYVWESFNYPTDTILPNQTLSLGGMLYSRLTQTNYSRGRFMLRFINGNLELNPVAWPSQDPYGPYYSSGTNSSNSSLSGHQLIFGQTGEMNIVRENGETVPLSWQSNVPNYVNSYHRATLDFDGVFRHYISPKNTDGDRNWTVVRYIPGNICMDLRSDIGSGACGFNSYCTSSAGTPTCQCPIGYSFMDPENEFRGCEPNLPLGCGVDNGSTNPEELYDMKVVENLNWPLGDYDSLRPYNQTQCEQACLHDCRCAIAIYDMGKTCWMKKLPLANGRTETALAIIKVRKGVLPPPKGNIPDDPISASRRRDHKRVLLWSILFSSSGIFNIIALVAIFLLIFSRRSRKDLNKIVRDSNVVPAETNLRIFTFKELEEATKGFKEELGMGSFGIVYKGALKFGSKLDQVAVKKLDKLSKEGEKEFNAEVSAIGKTHHRNLVQLLGYCQEGTHRLLVYEFMTNGSLSNFLFDLPRPDWHQRTQVALGIARGLVYLHEECNAPIIHCDIKPQNILIDENFTARISDFGLAKSLMFNQTRTHTGIRGTRGYVAPEWFKNVPVTIKVDVYSFGVVLLEIICCRRSVAMEFEEEERVILSDWAYDCFVGGRLDILVDKDEEAMSDITMLRRWVMTALCCIQEDPSKRPTMKMVIQMLEGYVEVFFPTTTTTSLCLYES